MFVRQTLVIRAERLDRDCVAAPERHLGPEAAAHIAKVFNIGPLREWTARAVKPGNFNSSICEKSVIRSALTGGCTGRGLFVFGQEASLTRDIVLASPMPRNDSDVSRACAYLPCGGQTDRKAGWVTQNREGSVALSPHSGLVRRKWVVGGLLRGASRRVIGWRKFRLCKLFTLKFARADSANGFVVRRPGHLKQLGLIVRQDLLAWFKGFNRNNVATLKLGLRIEATPDFCNVFNPRLFGEEMACGVDSSNFNGNIDRKTLFPSLLLVGNRLCLVPVRWIRLAHRFLNANNVPKPRSRRERKQMTYVRAAFKDVPLRRNLSISETDRSIPLTPIRRIALLES